MHAQREYRAKDMNNKCLTPCIQSEANQSHVRCRPASSVTCGA
jgi:hypothetical protein